MVTCLRSVKEEDVALRGIEVPNAWRRLRKVCEQLHTLQVHTASHLTPYRYKQLQLHFTLQVHLTGTNSFTPYRYKQLHTLQVHTASGTLQVQAALYRYKLHTLQVQAAYTLQVHTASLYLTGTYSFTPCMPYRYIQLHTLQVHTASHLTGRYIQLHTLQVHTASHLTGTNSLHLQVKAASHLTGTYSFTPYR